jgi:hypothetical protein
MITTKMLSDMLFHDYFELLYVYFVTQIVIANKTHLIYYTHPILFKERIRFQNGYSVHE